MRTRTIPLLSYFSIGTISSPWLGPEMPRSAYDALVVVTCEAVTGSPGAATVTPKFQLWHSVIGGNQEEVVNGGSGVDPTNSWFDLGATANPSLLPDGDWAATADVSAATTSAPVIVGAKTIRGGFPWRLKLAWALTGGTSPTMRLSAIAYLREGFVGGFDRVESSA